MVVLIVTLVFPPDGVSTAHLMGDLARDLQAAGKRVVVVTTSPHYNYLGRHYKKHDKHVWGGLVSITDFHGIKVFQILMPQKSKSLILRCLSWLWFHGVSVAVAMCLASRPNVVLAPSPPLTIGLAAYIISKRFRAPFIYNVQELYPDIAIDLGIIRSKSLIGLLLRLEAFIYSRASAVTVISNGMKTRLAEKGVPYHKVKHIPNFVDTEQFHPMDNRAGACGLLSSLGDKFIVSYAGNVGPAQNLTVLIDTAEILQGERRLHFVIMGAGSELQTIQQRAKEKKLTNITFVPYQPLSSIPGFYHRSELNVVALAAGVTSAAVPSKILRIMACGGAVVAITDDGSDLAEFVTSTNCGVVVRPRSPQALARSICILASDPIAVSEMGGRGAEVIRMQFSRDRVAKEYAALIDSVAMPGRYSRTLGSACN